MMKRTPLVARTTATMTTLTACARPSPARHIERSQTNNDFRVTADKKLLVAQDMLGQNAGGNAGDPAMSLAVATEQYRMQYLVHAPTFVGA